MSGITSDIVDVIAGPLDGATIPRNQIPASFGDVELTFDRGKFQFDDTSFAVNEFTPKGRGTYKAAYRWKLGKLIYARAA